LCNALPRPRGGTAIERTRRVVVAVGNAYRGDDAVALAVVERLRDRVPADVEVVACEQEPTRLLDAWQDAATAIVVDAVTSGAEPGTLHRYDASDRPLPSRVFRSSTHAFSVGETIELARALGKLPPRVVVYGIEGERFESGEELSARVAAAVEPAVEAVAADIE
jgi:hydrogenase maturation protease